MAGAGRVNAAREVVGADRSGARRPLSTETSTFIRVKLGASAVF